MNNCCLEGLGRSGAINNIVVIAAVYGVLRAPKVQSKERETWIQTLAGKRFLICE